MTTMTYDSFIETEEFITAEEYQKRRAEGKIDPQNTRIVLPDLIAGQPGGFKVKLATPRYRIAFNEKEQHSVF